MGIKTYQEKNAKPMEKELAQSDIPVKRKMQTTIRKYHVSGSRVGEKKQQLGRFFFLVRRKFIT